MVKAISFAGMILFFGIIFCFAQEEFTITTYYPSPYGSYQELDVYRSITYKPVDKDTLAFPREGELIYNIDKKFYYYNGIEWKELGNPKLVTAASWGHPELGSFGGENFDIFSGDWETQQSFSIPSDAKQWICSYSVHAFEPLSGSFFFTGGSSRIVCDGEEIYVTHHHKGGYITSSKMNVQSSNNLNCDFQLKSDFSDSRRFKGGYGGYCYYVKL